MWQIWSFSTRFFNIASYYLNCLAISRFSDSPRFGGQIVRLWVDTPNRESHSETVRVGRSVIINLSSRMNAFADMWLLLACVLDYNNIVTSGRLHWDASLCVSEILCRIYDTLNIPNLYTCLSGRIGVSEALGQDDLADKSSDFSKSVFR